MRLKQLAIALSKLPTHPQTSVELEQYAMEGGLAAQWIAAMAEAGDIDADTKVVDLGAGNGILGIGLLLAGAASATLVDIDAGALKAAQQGVDALGLESKVNYLESDVSQWDEWPEISCDLLVTNPPWGVQTPQADRVFLVTAFASPASVIHLMHNAKATHISGLAADAGWTGEVLMEADFALPAAYEHHTTRRGTTRVACWRFTR